MVGDFRLADIQAIEGLDSRARPTLLCRATLHSGHSAVASVPSGASTGQREALELRDGNSARFLGAGVQKAVAAVNGDIRQLLLDKDVREQQQLDRAMVELDGTADRSRLGANAILAASLALVRVAALATGSDLYRWFSRLADRQIEPVMPVPMFNVLNGGAHANNDLDIQEFMVLPTGASSFADALRAGAEIYACLKRQLDRQKHSTAVGDEGGFAPAFSSARQALDSLMEAVEQAGYRPGEDVHLGLDCAASELYRDGRYRLPGEGFDVDAAGFCQWLGELADDYPICSLEDGMDENDSDGWRLLTERLGSRVQLVADDLFVTREQDLRQGAADGLANSILIKPNQVGSISETLSTVSAAVELGYPAVISHRSGDTEDTTIADLAVGLAAGQCKIGAPCRSERVAKYNRLLWIERDEGFAYPGLAALAGRA